MTEMTRYTIVNVEEKETARHARTELLRDAGYRVLEVETQMEAVGLAEGERSALMLGYGDNDEQFRLLANNALTLMWMNGPEGCEFVNEAYLRFLGVSNADVRG